MKKLFTVHWLTIQYIMIKFPYGISDLYQILTEDYFYVDRTDRIPLIESSGKQLLFLRPRRFGKSLWLSTLENYYDLAKAGDFERLFGHLAVGKSPTPLHNQYLILRWNFSVVSPQGDAEAITTSLYDHINVCIQAFIDDYSEFLNPAPPIYTNNAISSFRSLLSAVRRSPYRLYLLIDEYDNFANEVLTASKERYEALVYGEGIIKTLFKAIKDAASGQGLDRVFITGVSPIVMSDVTSGYNVAKNIYLLPDLNDLCGFTETETQEIVNAVAESCDYSPQQADEAMMMMRSFYKGYRFTDAETDPLYNPTLTFYFLDYWQRYCRYPREMQDYNMAMDRNKIAYIARLPRGKAVINAALDEARSLTLNRLSTRFGVEDIVLYEKSAEAMSSLLYFFGVLTIEGSTPTGKLTLRVPNLITRQLYLEELQSALIPSVGIRDNISQIVDDFLASGDIAPLCAFVEENIFASLDNRDYRWANEFSVKIAFLTLLFNDILYIVDSEPALRRSYADLLLILRPDRRNAPLFDLLFEFKYISLKEAGLSAEEARAAGIDTLRALPPVAAKLSAARQQLERYRQILLKRYGDALKLRVYALVSLGFERLVWAEHHKQAT